MCDVVRELDKESYDFVVNCIYENYQYILTLEEVKEYVRLATILLAEKKISVIKQEDIISMVSKLIIKDADKFVLDGELKKPSKTLNNNVVFEDKYALVFKSAYNKLDEKEQLVINNAMLNGILNEENRCEYANAVMNLASIIYEDDAHVASVVLYEMLKNGHNIKRSK